MSVFKHVCDGTWIFFLILVNLMITRILQILTLIFPFFYLPVAVKDVQMLVSRDGPSDLSPASILVSPQCCVLSFKAAIISYLLSSPWLSSFCPRMQNPSSNYFQAFVASRESNFPKLPMLSSSRILGPWSNVSNPFLPLSLRLSSGDISTDCIVHHVFVSASTSSLNHTMTLSVVCLQRTGPSFPS